MGTGKDIWDSLLYFMVTSKTIAIKIICGSAIDGH